jgi:hypothetical protein
VTAWGGALNVNAGFGAAIGGEFDLETIRGR